MHLVAFLEPAQDGDRCLDAWLVDGDRLEASLQCGILFDVLAVLIERGGADTAEFASGELGLEHVGGIGCALGGPGTNQRVQLVDEQDDLPVTGSDLLDEGLEAILEFPAVLRAGDHGAQVHRDEGFVLERLGDVAADDAPGQPLSDRSLADARFADEHRVIFRAATEHLHHAPDFIVSPDDGVNFSLLGQGGEILAVLFESLKFILRVGIGDTLVAAHLAKCIEQSLAPEVVGLKYAAKRVAALGQQAE